MRALQLILFAFTINVLHGQTYYSEDGTPYEDEAFWSFSEADHLRYIVIEPEELAKMVASHEVYYIGSLLKSHCFYVVKEGRLKESLFVKNGDALVGKYWVSREEIDTDVVHERDLSSVFSCYKFRRVRDVDFEHSIIHTIENSSYNNQNSANKS